MSSKPTRWPAIVVVAFLLCLLVAVLIVPMFRAFVVVNAAQLFRLHGQDPLALFIQALALSPENNHMRLQTGIAYLEAGDYQQASDVLMPLAKSTMSQSAKMSLILALAGSGRVSESTEFYSGAGLSHILPRSVALRMLSAVLGEKHPSLSNDDLYLLFLRSFGLNVNEEARDYFYTHILTSDALNKWLVNKSRWQWRENAYPSSFPSSTSRVDCLSSAKHIDELITEFLGVEPGEFSLSKNLARNGDFESINRINEEFNTWQESYMSTGDPWNVGLFVLGQDNGGCSDGEYALRIDGLDIQTLTHREPSRAGLWHSAVEVQAKSPYLITFVYRTENVNDLSATMYLSDFRDVFDGGELILPPTHGKWQRVILLAWNHKELESKIQPLLRSFSTGTVMFDNFEIHLLATSKSLNPARSQLKLIPLE